MKKLTPEKELELRAQVKADIESVPGTGKVFAEPVLIDSKQEFVDEFTEQVVAGNNREVRFCQILFQGWRDLPNAGGTMCADDPVVEAIYRLHFFHEFVEKRSDGTSSHNSVTAMALNLRNKFLDTQDIGAYTERTPLTLDGSIILGTASEFFPGAYGHYFNAIVRVELT